MAKFTQVELENTKANTKQSFEITHAERILSMGNSGGWQLPSDSPYYFDKENGIGYRPDKKASSKSSKGSNNKASNNASK